MYNDFVIGEIAPSLGIPRRKEFLGFGRLSDNGSVAGKLAVWKN